MHGYGFVARPKYKAFKTRSLCSFCDHPTSHILIFVNVSKAIGNFIRRIF